LAPITHSNRNCALRVVSVEYHEAKGGVEIAFDFAGAAVAPGQALAVLAQHGGWVVGMSGKPLMINDTTTFSALGQRVRGHFGSRRHHLEELMRLIELGRSICPDPSPGRSL
jgi:D-arabinose 1-dehydrogenase-like Zn-dependent alcohol dehydrogenase